MTNTLLELKDVSKCYREGKRGRRVILQGANLSLRNDDSSVAILGRSGAGKTTLLKILAGLDLSFEGSYLFQGVELEKSDKAMSQVRKQHIGYVPQHRSILGDRSLLENVVIGQKRDNQTLDMARELLDRVGLGKLAHEKGNTLSGGEAQRAAIARALVKQPRIILADEPTGSLDRDTEKQIVGIFEQIVENGTTLVLVTHNLQIADFCKRKLFVEDGKLIPYASSTSAGSSQDEAEYGIKRSS